MLSEMQKTLDFAAFLQKTKGFLLAEKEGFEPSAVLLKALKNQGFLSVVAMVVAVARALGLKSLADT